ESEDKPPKWIQLVFIVTLLVPIAVLVLALRDVFVRRLGRVSGPPRHYPLAVTTDAARGTGSGSEPLMHDPRSPRKPNDTQQSEVAKLKAKAKPAPARAKPLAAIGSEGEDEER